MMEVGGTSIPVHGMGSCLTDLDCLLHPHGVAMLMKLHLTLKRMLVHQKDKGTPQENSGVVYQVPCKDCQDLYTGETELR